MNDGLPGNDASHGGVTSAATGALIGAPAGGDIARSALEAGGETIERSPESHAPRSSFRTASKEPGMGSSITALMVLLATFLALSLGLWNGCFGSRIHMESNASAAQALKEIRK